MYISILLLFPIILLCMTTYGVVKMMNMHEKLFVYSSMCTSKLSRLITSTTGKMKNMFLNV